MNSTLLRWLAVAFGGVLVLPRSGIAQPAPEVKLTVAGVRELLVSDFGEVWRDKDKLVKVGAAAFPAYEAIIADPRSGETEYGRIFWVLHDIPADRTRFIEPVIKSLTSRSEPLRRSAVRLLGKIGTEKEIAPIVALLSDEEISVVHEAAAALAAIGGERELVALEIWIRAAKAQKLDSLFIEGVSKPCDALKKRLEDTRNKIAPMPRLK